MTTHTEKRSSPVDLVELGHALDRHQDLNAATTHAELRELLRMAHDLTQPVQDVVATAARWIHAGDAEPCPALADWLTPQRPALEAMLLHVVTCPHCLAFAAFASVNPVVDLPRGELPPGLVLHYTTDEAPRFHAAPAEPEGVALWAFVQALKRRAGAQGDVAAIVKRTEDLEELAAFLEAALVEWCQDNGIQLPATPAGGVS